ncbi:MAG: hypothetical protein KKD38_02190 [Candidatus Delongbacteria bacterium]|nr:hypothetical protein [Candidatus Delongbacteria bacterium]
MKKNIVLLISALMIFSFFSCSPKPVSKEGITRTLIATVVAQKGVLVGEYKDGAKVIDKNITEKIITWEGFSLVLRTESGEVFEYLSKELYYEGDRVLIRVQDGKILSVKYSP